MLNKILNLNTFIYIQKAVDYLMEDKYIDEFHLRNIGKLVEDVEGDLRSSLDTIYVGKTKEVNIFTNLINLL